ncbi:MAG TPA: ATP-dependent 6-phosphofructokinase [Anaerolineaceae bacterium]|nr:ATP-dependent 6-phosphofructokinase [Anaerolineaceae bacterium]
MAKYIGVLTAGGDTPGLNAALRALGKSALGEYNLQLIGFYDGFRGLMNDRSVILDEQKLSGILTFGGTVLGTSRDKPHRMPVGDKLMDMTDAMLEVYHKHHLDALVCIGGGGTQKNAYRLMQKGMNVITIPKTIDRDIAMTDATIGFDTALGIATEAVDRLHSTAHSHHRIVLVELMGHNAGWLALGAGVAGGADVILIPEIPYEPARIAEAILARVHSGKRFSIVAISEGATSKKAVAELDALTQEKKNAKNKEEKRKVGEKIENFLHSQSNKTMLLAQELESLTGLESRVTILGYVQRGGTPSARDRLLATELGTTAASLLAKEKYGCMVAVHEERIEAVPLEKVVDRRKVVPLDHSWVKTAKRVETCMGDDI